MGFLDLIGSSFISLQRNKTRSFLTMLGIIIGVGAVIGMLAIGKGSEESIKGELGKLGSNSIYISPAAANRGGVNLDLGAVNVFKLSDIDRIIEDCPHVSYITPIVQSKVQAVNGTYNCRPIIYGVYPDYFIIQNFEVKYGTGLTEKTGRSTSKVCLLGITVAQELFSSIEDAVGSTIRLNKIPFKIIGILKEKGQTFGMDQDNIIIAPFKTVQKRIIGTDYLSSIIASTKSEKDVTQATEELEDLFINKLGKVSAGEPKFQIRTQKEMMDILNSVTGMITILLAAIASISLMVGGIGIMNIMLVSVTERTREIGLRLAVGARKKDILLQFLIESVVLSLVGGGIGIVLGFSIARLAEIFTGWEVVITPFSIILAFGFSSLIGVVFGYFPARKASNLHPIQALKFE